MCCILTYVAKYSSLQPKPRKPEEELEQLRLVVEGVRTEEEEGWKEIGKCDPEAGVRESSLTITAVSRLALITSPV